MAAVELVERRPSVEEYGRLILGMGRVVGDGGLPYDLSDVVVVSRSDARRRAPISSRPDPCRPSPSTIAN
jgi:hypothetical protein